VKKKKNESKSREYSKHRFLGQVGVCSAALAGAPLVFTKPVAGEEKPPQPVTAFIEQRGHYRIGNPLYQKVNRFISKEEVACW
jgi:hypothetical protein